MSFRRGPAERALFYVLIHGIGTLAMIVGGMAEAVGWARGLRLRRPASRAPTSISPGTP